MANTFYRYIEHETLAEFMPNMARFLINDHPTETGPGFSVIDTYSSAASTPHEVPSDATDMDSLAADNGWRTGTIATSDYIILQSADASNKFQVGFELQSASVMRMIVAPLGGFSTVADNNDMTTAGNWASAKLANFDMTFDAGNDDIAKYLMVTEKDRMALMAYHDTSRQMEFTYIGKLEAATLFTGDEYPVCVYIGEAAPYAGDNSGIGSLNWRRLSKVDDSTEASCGAIMHGLGPIGTLQSNGTTDATFDIASQELRLLDTWLCSTTASHRGLYGRIQDIWTCNETKFTFPNKGIGTLDSKQYVYFTDLTGTSPIILPWDGTTDVEAI